MTTSQPHEQRCARGGVVRCPTWEEMCWIKGQFWGPEDRVIQYHPPASEYINDHPYCLHLWRPIGAEIPAPPSWMVGGDLGAAVAARRF